MIVAKTTKLVPSTDKKHILHGTVFLPEGEAKGFFHVVHGMTEHIGRYHSFMQRMAENGYICFGFDNLGHGHTVSNEGELGFIAHRDGWRLLAADVRAFGLAMREEYGQKPYILMGHSMGSFIVRVAAAEYEDLCDKLIIMGTGGPNPLSAPGLAIIDVIRFFRGERHVSPFVHNLAFGGYNKRFGEERKNNWLTKDEQIKEKYAKDPLCSFRFTVSAMHDLITLNAHANRKAWFEGISRTLPMLIVSGTDDPVGDYGKGVRTVYDRLLSVGADVTLKLYDGCRHEILNDTCREQVEADIKNFLQNGEQG